ncbi:SIMPL domain-containing protein [Desulfuribacillus alkaliarsenatis]|uniref:SIMPL domain-containing protein n=1 Tax=Desulfuribacillus alkaliarsenatis TaxID=766136 RepID=A0A1E5G1F2_9FIRM|nr:SIMPL domain-containing protein [Desulfuribacillus alkaliarsenatis]OEF96693.1 hypothetical protein BHF68_06355 [Desulfuribacillus alkaliarsenatis]
MRGNLKSLIVPILIVTIVFVVYSFSQPAQAEIDVPGDKTDLPVINVTGVGEISVKPDAAQISLGVRTESATAKEAQTENARITNQLIAALKAAGIEENNMQTQNFSVHPQYDYNVERGQTRRIIGYQVQNMLIVKIDDIAQVGPVIDSAREAGVNEVNSIRFLTTQERTLRNDALTKAVEDAKQKADTIAAALGKTVQDVVSVTTDSVSAPPNNFRNMQMAETADSSTPIIGGELTINASVHVQFTMK